MKKSIALILALVMCLGILAGCVQPTDPTTSNQQPTTTKNPGNETNPSNPVVNDKPYEGTEIEVWGVAADKFADGNVNANDFIDLVLVAMEEWCEANGVTLKYAGEYNQNAYMAAVNGGRTPELILLNGSFPNLANLGITKPMSDEGAAAIGAVVGDFYVDALNYQGKSHGTLLPVNGNNCIWYNKTIFEMYGLKTPKEYWEEGNWNWETMIQCLKDVTKDLDGDGVYDTFGTQIRGLSCIMEAYEQGADGKVTSLINTDKFRAVADMFYTGYTEGWIQDSSINVFKMEAQRCVFRFGDAELYNPDHQYRELANGDVLELVPIPTYGDEAQMNQRLNWSLYNCASNNNQAATEAMLAYVMDCCEKYMADLSMGALETECKGLQGTCELSQKFLEGFATRLETYREKSEKDYYDQEHVEKMVQLLLKDTPYTIEKTFLGVTNPTSANLNNAYSMLYLEPAATSVAKALEVHNSQLKTYNDTYVFAN